MQNVTKSKQKTDLFIINFRPPVTMMGMIESLEVQLNQVKLMRTSAQADHGDHKPLFPLMFKPPYPDGKAVDDLEHGW